MNRTQKNVSRLYSRLSRLGSLRAGEYLLSLRSGYPLLWVGYHEPRVASTGEEALVLATEISQGDPVGWHCTIPLRILDNYGEQHDERYEESHFDIIGYVDDVAASYDTLSDSFTDEETDLEDSDDAWNFFSEAYRYMPGIAARKYLEHEKRFA